MYTMCMWTHTHTLIAVGLIFPKHTHTHSPTHPEIVCEREREAVETVGMHACMPGPCPFVDRVCVG